LAAQRLGVGNLQRTDEERFSDEGGLMDRMLLDVDQFDIKRQSAVPSPVFLR